ncbi:hypothetical protein, partial [Paraburkholderia sediminicola]|uniref:hypothetical protein n=1 Tax=Paraburkholderia sediminicola TaxID=458836 RepID=UPI0038BAF92C
MIVIGAVFQHTDISFEVGVSAWVQKRVAEATPMAPATSTEAGGFPCRPVRDARSAEWELMNPLSLTRNVREHGFQMHHYPLRTTVP